MSRQIAEIPTRTFESGAVIFREGHEVLATHEGPPGVWTLTIRRGP